MSCLFSYLLFQIDPHKLGTDSILNVDGAGIDPTTYGCLPAPFTQYRVAKKRCEDLGLQFDRLGAIL